MIREIVLDTETTGLDPLNGDRIVEIGCLELINHVPTEATFHRYVNPGRPMPREAFEVHGLSDEFLADKPAFADIAGEFLAFIADSPLIIHNAAFDIGFLNAELVRSKLTTIAETRAIDTVRMARKKFPGAPASLDALCRRFNVDNTARTKHGALLDAELLACVYLELIGGRQPGFALTAVESANVVVVSAKREARVPRPHAPTPEELAAHAAFLEKISEPLWLG